MGNDVEVAVGCQVADVSILAEAGHQRDGAGDACADDEGVAGGATEGGGVDADEGQLVVWAVLGLARHPRWIVRADLLAQRAAMGAGEEVGQRGCHERARCKGDCCERRHAPVVQMVLRVPLYVCDPIDDE